MVSTPTCFGSECHLQGVFCNKVTQILHAISDTDRPDSCHYNSCTCFLFLVYFQHVPLQIVILHAWKDHRTLFTLYTFPS